jgi:hypothetical protein
MVTYPWSLMDEKEPTQRTPAGAEIPIPTRKDVFGDLDKAMRPVPPKSRKRRPKK